MELFPPMFGYIVCDCLDISFPGFCPILVHRYRYVKPLLGLNVRYITYSGPAYICVCVCVCVCTALTYVLFTRTRTVVGVRAVLV